MTVEHFKGIDFVRISSLAKDQQQQVWASFDQEKIIKIVKDKSLLNDCILYSDFQAWQSRQSTRNTPELNPVAGTSTAQPSLQPAMGKLAFK